MKRSYCPLGALALCAVALVAMGAGAAGAFRIDVTPSGPVASGSSIAGERVRLQQAQPTNRAESILRRMTLEEKINLLGGRREFHLGGQGRLGIPDIVMSDGPAGCTGRGESTAYPAPICLAAAWSADLAFELGAAIGRDCRARGVHILLGPGVNIYRSPLCGRNFEYMGEDPHLTSRIAVSVIKGIQSKGVAAAVKHFVANNQEYDRHGTSSEVDQRTLREIYLPAFERAVREGGVSCVMSAYNQVNGVFCSEHSLLNVGLLKGEWGFEGILMSDWGGTHHAVGAALGGLDLEMPRGEHMSPDSLMAAVDEGLVAESVIDEKAGRILETMERMGFFDRVQEDHSIPKDDSSSAAVALKIAEEGIVLLKNDGGNLPLDPEKLGSILVIGPNAHPTPHGGGGSSYTIPFHSVSILEGIETLAGGRFAVKSVPRDRMYVLELLDLEFFEESTFYHRDADGALTRGLYAEYFDNVELSGDPVRREVIERANLDWGHGAPEGIPADRFSLRLTGLLRPKASGEYVLAVRSDDGARVHLDGEMIVDEWAPGSPRVGRIRRYLRAGEQYEILIEFYENAGVAEAKFGWAPVRVEEDVLGEICELARAADAVILCVGFDRHSEKEGRDRSYRLPGLQETLLARVSEINPNCVAVVVSGGGVRTATWIDGVPAVLQAWYLGQEGGTAVAKVLLGEVSPSGKLPITMEGRYEDVPAAKHYYGPEGKTFYREEIFTGYRGYDRSEKAPLFPFGHGLSYTTFSYGELEVVPASKRTGASRAEGKGKRDLGDGDERELEAGGGMTANAAPAEEGDLPLVFVSFEVKNAGDMPASEIAQVYVRDIEASVLRPSKELKGFHKVYLNPGDSRRITIPLRAGAFSFWDPVESTWRLESGRFEILVGASSADIRLRGHYVH